MFCIFYQLVATTVHEDFEGEELTLTVTFTRRQNVSFYLSMFLLQVFNYVNSRAVADGFQHIPGLLLNATNLPEQSQIAIAFCIYNPVP
jgi:hypothetical protein